MWSLALALSVLCFTLTSWSDCQRTFQARSPKLGAKSFSPPPSGFPSKDGGAKGARTPDLRRARAALSHLSYSPATARSVFQRAKKGRMAPLDNLVGLGRFELPTSRLSGVRSNQLSYRPPQGSIAQRPPAQGIWDLPKATSPELIAPSKLNRRKPIWGKLTWKESRDSLW